MQCEHVNHKAKQKHKMLYIWSVTATLCYKIKIREMHGFGAYDSVIDKLGLFPEIITTHILSDQYNICNSNILGHVQHQLCIY